MTTYLPGDLPDLTDPPAWAVEYHRDTDAPARLRTWQGFNTCQDAADRAEALVALGFRTALVTSGEALTRRFFRLTEEDES